jgi:hypothetical protein
VFPALGSGRVIVCVAVPPPCPAGVWVVGLGVGVTFTAGFCATGFDATGLPGTTFATGVGVGVGFGFGVNVGVGVGVTFATGLRTGWTVVGFAVAARRWSPA